MISPRKSIKMKSHQARIHFVAAENFYEIAKVKAEGKEENLSRAIQGFLKALEYFSESKNKLKFAHIQNNLGNAYSDLAEVRDGESNLGKAVAAFEEALSVYTFDAFPVYYAMTQNNLGNAYRALAEVRDKESNLGKAVAAFEEALRVYTLDAFPVVSGSKNGAG
jgi:tetratricopeptide (TPR) repeat protein